MPDRLLDKIDFARYERWIARTSDRACALSVYDAAGAPVWGAQSAAAGEHARLLLQAPQRDETGVHRLDLDDGKAMLYRPLQVDHTGTTGWATLIADAREMAAEPVQFDRIAEALDDAAAGIENEAMAGNDMNKLAEELAQCYEELHLVYATDGYPFCMTRVMSEGAELPERVACVERSAINDEGIALFDGQGAPLPDWAQRQKLLVEFETDLTRTEAMCTRIAELQLLEPFVMQAMRKGQETLRLTQMFRIDEAKVADLPVDILKEFADKDIMGCIYAHLLSLTNFNRLVMRQSPPAIRGMKTASQRASPVSQISAHPPSALFPKAR